MIDQTLTITRRILLGALAVSSVGLAVVTATGGAYGLLGASLPKWLPARDVWMYGCALLAFIGSVGLCVPRSTRYGALILCAYHVLWIATSIPLLLHNVGSLGSWYSLCEAITCLVGPLIFYVYFHPLVPTEPSSVVRARVIIRSAQVLFALMCIFYGLSHFEYADYTASMVPVWLPDHLDFAYGTGLFHIAAGVGIIFGIFARPAALLEATMMTLFGVLVWVPSFFAEPRPTWAASPQSQWSELVLNFVLAVSAWIIWDSMSSGEYHHHVFPKHNELPSLKN